MEDFSDHASRLASVVIEYSTAVQPDDYVIIIGPPSGRELAAALFESTINSGGRPRVVFEDIELTETLLRMGTREQITAPDPLDLFVYREPDVLIRIDAPQKPELFSHIPAERTAWRNQGLGARLGILQDRMGNDDVRYCLVSWPTLAGAQQTGMDLDEFRQLLYRASALHLTNPIEYWRGVRRRHEALTKWLEKRSEVVVSGPDIELSFRMDGRRWISAHGDINFPDGEIYTGPIEDSVEGEVAFNMPSLTFGRKLLGARLRFEAGQVVDAGAESGEEFLLAQLDLDDGARRLGEFAIGTNEAVTRVTGSTLLDEKIGGSIHMALGHSIKKTGGVNESQIHWDMVHSMKDSGTIHVDGELFYDSGTFVIEL